MPRYLVIRKFEVDEDEMPVLGRRSRQGIENQFTSITWEHSHVVVDEEERVAYVGQGAVESTPAPA